MRRRLTAWLLVALTAAACASCSSVRATLKIGLLAPFEGLHRRSGYAALEAVRWAIADFPYVAAGILPLALDDGAQPQQALRSARKLAADPRLAAVVGPLSPEVAFAVEPALASLALPHYTPYSLPGSEWAAGLVQAAAQWAQQEGAEAIVLAGWTPGWPQLDEQAWTAAAGLPARLDDDAGSVGAQEAVFWLGSAEEGARYLAQLRIRQPDALFVVLGPQGEDPVFAERAGSLDRVYWTIWMDGGYTAWSDSHTHSPTAYLVYRAALEALQAATGQGRTAAPSSWAVQLFRYDASGKWLPLSQPAAGF